MGLIGVEGNDLTTTQDATQLHLVWRSTDLSNNRCSGSRHDTQLETSTMIGPDSTVAAVGGHQHAGVVDRRHADCFRD